MTAADGLTLPRWLRLFFLAVAEAPWTNLKTFNALTWANITGIALIIAAAFKIAINLQVLELWLVFLGSWLGIAMLGSGLKRITYKPSPPNQPDVEDAAAGATTDEFQSPPAAVQARAAQMMRASVQTRPQGTVAPQSLDPAAVPGEGD